MRINKKKIVEKVLKNEPISVNEIKILLTSKWGQFKSIGIKAVNNGNYKHLHNEVKKLTNDKNSIIASDALDCIAEHDKKMAEKIAIKKIESANRYLQASSLFILGNSRNVKYFSLIKRKEIKYRNNFWRKICFEEAKYLLKENIEYIFEIIDILFKSKNYHVHCSALNTLNYLYDNKNKSIIKNALIKFKRQKKNIPRAVSTTLERVLADM